MRCFQTFEFCFGSMPVFFKGTARVRNPGKTIILETSWMKARCITHLWRKNVSFSTRVAIRTLSPDVFKLCETHPILPEVMWRKSPLYALQSPLPHITVLSYQRNCMQLVRTRERSNTSFSSWTTTKIDQFSASHSSRNSSNFVNVRLSTRYQVLVSSIHTSQFRCFAASLWCSTAV